MCRLVSWAAVLVGFYAALRQTPKLLKIGDVWPRDGPRGPGIPGAESASGTPGRGSVPFSDKPRAEWIFFLWFSSRVRSSCTQHTLSQ